MPNYLMPIGWKHEVNCLPYPVGNLAALEKTIRRVQSEPQLSRNLAQGGFELAQSPPLAAYLMQIAKP